MAMAMFNSYVSLPDGTKKPQKSQFPAHIMNYRPFSSRTHEDVDVVCKDKCMLAATNLVLNPGDSDQAMLLFLN